MEIVRPPNPFRLCKMDHQEGVTCCVPIRALEPQVGIARMKERRPAACKVEDVASGPWKLAAWRSPLARRRLHRYDKE